MLVASYIYIGQFAPKDTTQLWVEPKGGGDVSLHVFSDGGWKVVGGGDGKSAYELAVEKGYSGTLDEWLDSLQGKSFTYDDLTDAQKAELAQDAVAAANRAAQAVETIEAAINDLDPSQSAEDAVVELAARQGVLENNIAALGPKIDNIDAEVTDSPSEVIEVQNDAGTETIFSISNNGVDAKNLKSNGQSVLTQHQDISHLATKEEVEDKQDKIDDIETTTSNFEGDSIVFSNDYESEEEYEEYAKVSSNGVTAKDYLYRKGQQVKSLIPKDKVASTTVAVSNYFANIFSFIKDYAGRDIKIRCKSATNIGFAQVVYYVGQEVVYGSKQERKGYFIETHVPEGVTNCVLYVSVDASITVEIAEPSLNQYAHFTVGQTGNEDFASILEAVMESSRYQSSRIDVMEGEYDIRQEFIDFYGSDFFTNFARYNSNNQPNSPLGIYLSSHVHLVFSPDALVVFEGDDENADALKWFGPFYAAYKGFTLEGLTIRTKNCRYCVHDERSSDTDFYQNYYKNCKFYHDNTDPMNEYLYNACIGGGLGKHGLITVEGCYFETKAAQSTAVTAFSWHNSMATDAQSRLLIRDNYVAGKGYFRIGYYGSSNKITQVTVCGNNFGSPIVHNGEAGSTNVNSEIIEWNNIVRS